MGGSPENTAPRLIEKSPIRCSDLANPKAMRWSTRILVLVDSISARRRERISATLEGVVDMLSPTPPDAPVGSIRTWELTNGR